MRKELAVNLNERRRFVGKVERFGAKRYGGHVDRTVMLAAVRFADTDELATDHIWFTKTKQWADINIGDVVAFDARIAEYIKGDFEKGFRADFKLNNPTKFEIVEKAPVAEASPKPDLPDIVSPAAGYVRGVLARPQALNEGSSE